LFVLVDVPQNFSSFLQDYNRVCERLRILEDEKAKDFETVRSSVIYFQKFPQEFSGSGQNLFRGGANFFRFTGRSGGGD
jgi:hypothetical protein